MGFQREQDATYVPPNDLTKDGVIELMISLGFKYDIEFEKFATDF
jgi:hypothetical protein